MVHKINYRSDFNIGGWKALRNLDNGDLEGFFDKFVDSVQYSRGTRNPFNGDLEAIYYDCMTDTSLDVLDAIESRNSELEELGGESLGVENGAFVFYPATIGTAATYVLKDVTFYHQSPVLIGRDGVALNVIVKYNSGPKVFPITRAILLPEKPLSLREPD